jgi:hypothetical protein
MKNQFTISSAYQWGKTQNNNSEKAIKRIVEIVKNRFSNNENGKFNYNINYRKLRASAGRTMLDSIYKRIVNSQVVIIDLTENNPNVYLEAGIALAIEKDNPYLSIYFIREKKEGLKLPEGIPSDLQGYFITEYSLDSNGKVTFNDTGSLRMSIESDVKEYFAATDEIFNQIDEFTNDDED